MRALSTLVKALDLTSTGVQITYALSGMALYAIWRGLQLAKTSQDVVGLLGAIMPLLLVVLAKRFGDNIMYQRANGRNSQPTAPPAQPK